jgi:hypothetical protein
MGLLSLLGKNRGTMLCGHYCLEGEPTLLEAALAYERVYSWPLDCIWLANFMLFSLFCLELCNWF